MDDLARGERIKALRTARRLTQPAVVDLLRQKAGAPVVTLRGYQAWESGGGIRWDNAKVLADVFEVDPEYVMSGRGEQPETPDLFENGDGTQLDRIEDLLFDIAVALGVRQPDEDPAPGQVVEAFRDAAARAGALPQRATERPPRRRAGT